MLVRRAEAPTQLRHGAERMQTPDAPHIHQGTRPLAICRKRAGHEVFAERREPPTLVVPIAETGFLAEGAIDAVSGP
jgi:hypothetical protein